MNFTFFSQPAAEKESTAPAITSSSGVSNSRTPQDSLLRTEVSPKKYSSILIPVDFTEESMRAFTYAMPLIEKFSSKVILLHVIDPRLYAPELPYDSVQDLLPIEDARQSLRATAETMLKPEQLEKTLVIVGRPFSAIVDVAERQHVDLIILTSHCDTGWNHFFFGSQAETITRYAPCPVLIVPKM
ncbi:MAG: universal stress protein [Candidatus Methylacidiphilales bacterium]|nr:universal stress protein [Candidatus Methylacidiphilales bacterium]